MKTRGLGGDTGERRFVIVLDSGDEIEQSVTSFAESLRITGHFNGIGALREGTVAYWDAAEKAYRNIEIAEQAEVLALTGNLALIDGAPKVHAHAVLGLRNGNAVGGHVVRGVVHPTLELLFIESSYALRREKDQATGLDLLVL
jgi:uncharacterized protein